MSGIHWANIFSAAGGVSGAIAAFGAWRAATTSNATAAVLARIEHDRRQSELTPDFNITWKADGDDRIRLNVHLRGPVELRYLDEIRIRIDDDDMDRTVHRPSGRSDGRPTQEDVDNQVWGPFKFAPSADGADQFGRTVRPITLHVGRGRPFNMERIRAPFWYEVDDPQRKWDQEQAHNPIRFVLACKRGDLEWTIPYPVDPPVPTYMSIPL